MAERLTDKNTVSIYNNSNSEIYLGKLEEATKYIYKLAQLEDIMEKYGIESVEELDMKLANFDNFMKGNKFETIEDLQNALNGKFIEVFDEKNKIWKDMVKNLTKTEQDRDTWQKACELACDAMTKLGGDDCCGCRLNKEMCKICENKKGLIDYFYQQAKNGGK